MPRGTSDRELSQKIVAYVEEAGRPVTNTEIATAVGRKPNDISGKLTNLVRQGRLVRPEFGRYVAPGTDTTAPSLMRNDGLQQQVAEFVRANAPVTTERVMQTFDTSKSMSSVLTKLVRKGEIERIKFGVYGVPTAASAPTNGNGQHEVKAQVARRVSQDDRLATMLEVSGMHPHTQEDWLRVLQFIEVTRGAMA